MWTRGPEATANSLNKDTFKLWTDVTVVVFISVSECSRSKRVPAGMEAAESGSDHVKLTDAL